MHRREWLVRLRSTVLPALLVMMLASGCVAPAVAPAGSQPGAGAAAGENAGAGEATAAAAEAGAGEVITIRGMANDSFARAWQERLVPEFEKLHPNIKVEIDPVPYSDILPKSMLELTAADVAYDFIINDDPWTPQLAEAGLLADLKGEFAAITSEDYDWNDIHPSPLAAGEWNGVQYGVPVRSNLLLMFYNRDLYEEAGLNADEVLSDLTWEEFAGVMEQLVRDTNGDGQPDVWAIGNEFTRGTLAPTRWQTILNSNGGRLFDESLKPAFNTPEGAAALQTNLDWMQYGPPGIEAMGFNEMNEAFRQGLIATMFNWGSVYRAVAVDPAATQWTPEQIGVAPMPGGSACSASAHRGVYVGVIPARSSHKNEAWQFLQWLSSKEGERFAATEVGSFPARISTLTGEPPEPWLQPVYKAILGGYEGINCGSMWRPRLPDSDGVSQILATHHSRAVLGEVTPEQALTDAAAEIESFMAEKGYYE